MYNKKQILFANLEHIIHSWVSDAVPCSDIDSPHETDFWIDI